MQSSTPPSPAGASSTNWRGSIADSVTLVQLRDKNGSTRAMIEEARALTAVLAPLDIPLLINDRVDVALAVEADGVHIGQDDMSPADARLLLGRTAIIGLSIKSVAQAQAAPLDHLDYVGDRRRLRHHVQGNRQCADRDRGLARHRAGGARALAGFSDLRHRRHQ